MDRYTQLQPGICQRGGMAEPHGKVEEIDGRAKGVHEVLLHDLRLGDELCLPHWKLKAALRAKLSDLDSCVENCGRAISTLGIIQGLAAGTVLGVPPGLPVHQCYICMESHSLGLTYCSTCSGTVCAVCIPELVAHACDSGGVASLNGEAAHYVKSNNNVLT